MGTKKSRNGMATTQNFEDNKLQIQTRSFGPKAQLKMLMTNITGVTLFAVKYDHLRIWFPLKN
jgi:hypothetical protein